jgi:hypothetical protein
MTKYQRLVLMLLLLAILRKTLQMREVAEYDSDITLKAMVEDALLEDAET